MGDRTLEPLHELCITELIEDSQHLTDCLDHLSDLAARDLSLEQYLQRTLDYALSAVPTADGAVMNLLDHELPTTVVVTHHLVAEVDRWQDSSGQVPYLTALRDQGPVTSDSLGDDRRWPSFGPHAADLGLHSVLALLLRTSEGVVGTLSFYAERRNAFNGWSLYLAELFAVPAAAAVETARSSAHVKDLSLQLQTELKGKTVVDETIGLLISRYQTSAQDFLRASRAFEL